MDNNEASNVSNEDTDDEDTEYFLQATLGGYDIKEKIKSANDNLFVDYEEYSNIIRPQKVTFRDELVAYEPDYFSDFDDDDEDDGYEESPEVLSNSEQDSDVYTNPDPELSTIDNTDYLVDNEFGHYSTEEGEHEEDLTDSHVEAEAETNLIEEELTDQSDNTNDTKPDERILSEEELTDQSENTNDTKPDERILSEEEVIDDEITDEEVLVEIIEINYEEDIENLTETTRSNFSPEETTEEFPAPKKKSKEIQSTEIINCRIHCLEKKDLDRICGSIRNSAHISRTPPLKLQRRPCCTNRNSKLNLPTYNGLISEYGLTKSQLERRQRRKELNIQRKQEKSARILEEKRQKELYNEEIFCSWLKSLRERNQDSNNNKKGRTHLKERPKTASCLYSLRTKEKCKRRPNTSPCKGYTDINVFVCPLFTIKEVHTLKK